MLNAVLRLQFDDVRPEEVSPSYAGQSTRIDFLLFDDCIAVEAKMTRKGLADKGVSDQLILDIARYKSHPKVKTLVCLVYDPSHFIKNPDGLYNDLNGVHDGLEVRLIIVPNPD